MQVNLANLSDAQLGAIVRQSLSDEVIQALVENRPKALERLDRREVEARERLESERAERKDMHAWPAITVGTVAIEPLSIAEEVFDETAPRARADAYCRALRALGEAHEKESDDLTWRDLAAIHAWLVSQEYLTADERTKVDTLVRLANMPRDEAIARITGLRATTH